MAAWGAAMSNWISRVTRYGQNRFVFYCTWNFQSMIINPIYTTTTPSPSTLHPSPQVSCYSSSCPQGTYLSSPSSGSTLQLVLQGITTLCLSCDGLCASCTGPGNTSYTTCRYARRYALCVSGCDSATGIGMVHYLLCTYK